MSDPCRICKGVVEDIGWPADQSHDMAVARALGACIYCARECERDLAEMRVEFEALIASGVDRRMANQIMIVRDDRRREFKELLARSSLGSPDVVAARRQADPALVDRVLRRADELDIGSQ